MLSCGLNPEPHESGAGIPTSIFYFQFLHSLQTRDTNKSLESVMETATDTLIKNKSKDNIERISLSNLPTLTQPNLTYEALDLK